MQDLLLEILCWTDRSDAIDALFLCQSGIKGRKAEDEINSAIYSFAFKVMMINNEPKQRNDDEINLIVKWALKCLNTIASSPFFCNQNLHIRPSILLLPLLRLPLSPSNEHPSCPLPSVFHLRWWVTD